jgi:hypothetical protein
VGVFMHSDRKQDHRDVYDHLLDAAKHNDPFVSWSAILTAFARQDKS